MEENPTVVDLVDRALEGLRMAQEAPTPVERYNQAHIAALRATAALLAFRGRWPEHRGRKPRPASVWEVLPEVDPTLTEWARHFARTGRKRLAVERGAQTVEVAEAAEMLAHVRHYIDLVQERMLS